MLDEISSASFSEEDVFHAAAETEQLPEEVCIDQQLQDWQEEKAASSGAANEAAMDAYDFANVRGAFAEADQVEFVAVPVSKTHFLYAIFLRRISMDACCMLAVHTYFQQKPGHDLGARAL